MTDIAIALRGVSFTYADSDASALRDVDLTVHRGELIVVMGATGAGKTTLAKCLNRVIPAFQTGTLTGEITILGRRLTSEGVADLAGVVGLVSQDFEAQLFATNVVQELTFAMEHLGIAPAEMRTRVPAALAAVGLTGFERRDPTTLSGGEKQRLAIAAIVALRPPIFVFDEPTTDLDPIGKQEVFAVLDHLRRAGATLVVIEHEIAAAEHADRVVLMDGGRIVADAPPAELLPDVARLERHAVRPADVDRIAARLAVHLAHRSLDELTAVIDPRLRVDTPAPPQPGSTSDPILIADRVTYQYDSDQTALAAVSLEIRTGDSVALIGQNGSGKTTLAKLLNGLLTPTSGQVRLHGQPITDLKLNRVAGEVGYVFQNPDHQIFASTVHDEVAFGPRNLGLRSAEINERVDEALAAVGLRGHEAHDPFLFGKGQRQRLAVASLLALRPRVLLLDEPTTGLDYPEQRHMMDLVAKLQRQGMTLVMITHSPWVVAEYAQRGVLLAHGQVLFDGPLRDLFAEEALLERCHFRVPEVTRLGRRLGFTPLSVDELMQHVRDA
ncbi:MAG: energy-coupling factor ABC transporter ATP-binding protein [Deltaproteobacteria bacterium]|nr:energy-coupling factor ABC transporter ATP-binding protein [Deltaproteobacteria bacterium]MBI3386751.1 energy-coupling factor ABC transporter ATP-binding protein [Deltaproteobacteria bacterium]